LLSFFACWYLATFFIQKTFRRHWSINFAKKFFHYQFIFIFHTLESIQNPSGGGLLGWGIVCCDIAIVKIKLIKIIFILICRITAKVHFVLFWGKSLMDIDKFDLVLQSFQKRLNSFCVKLKQKLKDQNWKTIFD